ncbi:MAG: hypothetical protein RR744_10770 [Cellulosilyticaceae bacterium]
MDLVKEQAWLIHMGRVVVALMVAVSVVKLLEGAYLQAILFGALGAMNFYNYTRIKRAYEEAKEKIEEIKEQCTEVD